MKKRIIPVISVFLILAFVCSFFGCGTRANWAAQKSDTKMNELNLREANGSEKYIVFAALDENGELIPSGSSTPTEGYAVVGYTGLVAELIIPDEFAPTGGEAKPVTKVLAVDPYSAYKCYRNGVSYTGEDARLQNNTVVTTLSFGSNMTYVGAGVCAGMTNLYDVIFTRSGESVEIGAYAFAGCPNLSRLTYSRTLDTITFGEYPQTKVTDNAIVAELNAQAGTLPTASDPQAWTSYHYYANGSNATDFMWYIDLNYDSKKYRGVYFTDYRPIFTTNESNAGNSNQDDSGYNTSTVYWFRYDPISWSILSEENGDTFLLADLALDSQAFQDTFIQDGSWYNNSSSTPNGIYANNYKYSTIRKWLNETFYETAFNSIQKGMIQTVTIDNSAKSTNPNNNENYYNEGINNFACENTNDKVFLLSLQEATNEAYGFAAVATTYDLLRRKQSTEYAKAQGKFLSAGYGPWWYRSPADFSSSAWRVQSNGTVSTCSVHVTDNGVVPAIKVRLS